MSKQTSEGTWSRPLGGLEKVYHITSQTFKSTGREHWGLYAVCRVAFPAGCDAAEILRFAWQALRAQHPSIATITDGDRIIYRLGSADDWADQTFRVERTKSAADVVGEYVLKETASLIFFPTTSEVMLLTSHWRTDAIGCSQLLHHLFAAAASRLKDPQKTVPADMIPIRLSPSLEDAAGAPPMADAEIEATATSVTQGFAKVAANTLGLNSKGPSDMPPGRTACEALVLDEESSRALVSACKTRGISISAAAYAALGAAILDLRQHEGAEEFATIMAVNMRPHLPAPFNGPDSEHHCMCAAYVSSITPTVRRGESFAESTAALTRLFKEWHTPAFNRALREIYTRASKALASRGPPALGAPPRRPPGGITLSSLGVVDNIIQDRYGTESRDIRVFAYRFGVSMLTRQMLMYVWTFGGRVHISVNYNAAYYDSETPKDLIGAVKSVLEKQLGIALEGLAISE